MFVYVFYITLYDCMGFI